MGRFTRLSKTAKVLTRTSRSASEPVAKQRTKSVSPIGTSVSADIARKRRESPKLRAEHDRLAGFEQLARVVIMRRAELGISQEELARRMRSTASVVSRIESGQHATNARTLKRLGEALGGQAVIGFDFGNPKRLKRELVML